MSQVTDTHTPCQICILHFPRRFSPPQVEAAAAPGKPPPPPPGIWDWCKHPAASFPLEFRTHLEAARLNLIPFHHPIRDSAAKPNDIRGRVDRLRGAYHLPSADDEIFPARFRRDVQLDQLAILQSAADGRLLWGVQLEVDIPVAWPGREEADLVADGLH